MKVTILVANYNNGKYFNDFYQSILNQSYTNWDMVIVDDASTDDSKSLIQNSIQEDNRVKWFENTHNEGCGFTKRKCVDLADGELCAFVDPDDTLELNALETLVTAFQNNPESGLIYSRFRNVDENLQEISVYDHPKMVENAREDFLNLKGEISHLAMFKKSVYEETEGINPFLKRAVDQDLYLKLYEKAPVLFVDEILYNYRRVSSGISTGNNARKAYFWRWVVNMDAAKRRNLNLEDQFIEQMNAQFAAPKQQLLENSWLYPLFRIEQKIKKLLRRA